MRFLVFTKISVAETVFVQQVVIDVISFFAHTFVQLNRFVQPGFSLTCFAYSTFMQKLHIPYCSVTGKLTAAKPLMLAANDYAVEQQPWPRYHTDAEVRFSIVHNNEAIFILYRVKEKHVRHVNTEINGAVWEDSCAEFFIAFDEKGYYNLEVNCIGTSLLGYGSGRTNRELLPAEVIKEIRCDVAMKKETEYYEWELLLQIPVTVFRKHALTSLSAVSVSVNFYKCGDLLPAPHFICWNKIETADPDFHQPAFFAPAVFEEVTSRASI